MATPSTQAELDALSQRVRLEIASKLEDIENNANAELARLQNHYDKRTRELAAGESASLFDGASNWKSRNWWQDNG